MLTSYSNLPVGAPPMHPILDMGATAHFFPMQGYHIQHVAPLHTPIPITTPDGATMHATHTGTIPYPHLPPQACHAYLVPKLTSPPLISIGTLCDAGCTATAVTATTITITRNNNTALIGTCHPTHNLWIVDPPPIPHQTNAVVMHRSTAGDRVAFAHASLFSPVPATLLRALERGYITGFPGLNATTLKQHPPHDSIALYKGHLDQTRKNIQSTKRINNPDHDSFSTTRR